MSCLIGPTSFLLFSIVLPVIISSNTAAPLRNSWRVINKIMTPPPFSVPVVFFDGVCGLCNSFVDWVIRHDRKKIFRFAPIQGQTAKEHLGRFPPQEEDWSIIYADEKGTYERSSAVLKILSRLGGFSKIWALFLIFPPFIRDGVYRLIAKRRYRWFGKRDSCRLPTPQEKDRFLP